MKAITLKQPWATLVAHGIKKYEFRSWKTKYRGKVLIHAGRGIDKLAIKRFSHLGLEFPTSKIIAVVEIADCLELNSFLNNKITLENRLVYGHKNNRDGYAWVINNPKLLDYDYFINGKLGLWNIDIKKT